PDPLTKEAADRLNAWGDDQPSVAPIHGEQMTATAASSPWGDDAPSVAPIRHEQATATTLASPWGDNDDASPGP
ncbi:MAG: hypothetical protein QOH50_4734, partial [Kribbellaceae bacterium]|nr:hypothetical protein [Kribbellaceae bacterium]